ncbi:MAG: DNA replication/repair protein RecF [Actinomycetota bacterium]
MHVARLVLKDFRNYRDETVEFGPGINLVLGPNAQGKTNLLEAVYLLGGLGSPRPGESNLVRQGAQAAAIRAEIVKKERSVRVDLEIKPGRGIRSAINGSPAGARLLRELGCGIFFGPDELALVKGPPDGRRRFLDDLVLKLRPARETVKREWERALRQRNALLRSGPRAHGSEFDSSLKVWDDLFCAAAGALTVARLQALAALMPYAEKRYEELAGGGRLKVSYESAWFGEDEAQLALLEPEGLDPGGIADRLHQRLAELRPREIERGVALAGPQRDDLRIELLGNREADAPMLDARQFASQGDQRTAALALKLGEHEVVGDALGESPIMLLDDVYSELDPARREWLTAAVRGGGQILISATERLAQGPPGTDNVFQVQAGRVVQA